MTEEYIEYGEPLLGLNADLLKLQRSQLTFKACLKNEAFIVIELRQKNSPENQIEIIVVDCTNDHIPSQNKVGIQYKERLALVFSADDSLIPEVRVLRKSFPDTAHQNLVAIGEPKSLCLYSEHWFKVTREWTPQKHLNKILWWLEQASLEKLHQTDQPVEHLYHNSLFKVILPSDFLEKIKQNDLNFFLIPVSAKKMQITMLRGFFSKIKRSIDNIIQHAAVVLHLPPIVHGKIETYPLTLGQLSDQFEARGISFMADFRDKIKMVILSQDQNTIKDYTLNVFLILQIPIKRHANSKIEIIESRGFVIKANLKLLGVAFGDFELQNGFAAPLLKPISSDKWRDINIIPIDIVKDFSQKRAREISDIKTEDADFNGTLIGVGALGSALINIWARNGWGNWTLIDDDYLQPHNIARHLACNSQIGDYKVNAVKNIVQYIYNDDNPNLKCISANFHNNNNDEIQKTITSSDLIVDASTTLEIPRDLSFTDDRGRAVSVFLTPSGLAAGMLFEDSEKKINLSSLEAQYYRAIITNSWGENHLNNSIVQMRTGGGCRDLSLKISNEHVQLHSANIARHIRLHHSNNNAKIQVWHIDAEAGGVSTNLINPALTLIIQQGCWRIIWDTEIQQRLQQLRAFKLPNETGGILIGYIDQKIKSIFIVDALPAPIDSISDPQGFVRGTSQVKEAVISAQNRTDGIVSYIGEWHSHPNGVSANPSDLDMKLVNGLSRQLYDDGQPGVILIISDMHENWVIKDANE
jgi:integrative and conjugative element protein (TIGR02256 family)